MSKIDLLKEFSGLCGGLAVSNPRNNSKVEVIKTPSSGLDWALVAGGWPKGRFIQLAGDPSCGKTLISLLTIAHWQSLDPENCALFLDAEYTYDPDWAEELGVDNDRVILVKENDAAKLLTLLIGTYKQNKQKQVIRDKDGLLNHVMNKSIGIMEDPYGDKREYNLGKLGVIVLDSVASMTTPMELSSEVGKQNMSPMARLLSSELKKVTPLLSDSNVTMFAINQVRTDLGKMWGDPTTTPGGKALKHACSVMVMFKKSEAKDDQICDDQGNHIGHKVRAKVTKNKIGASDRETEFWVITDEGIVKREEELLTLACNLGIIDRPNNRTYVYNEEKYTSKADALSFIETNLEEIEGKVREAYLEKKVKAVKQLTLADEDEDITE